MSRDGHVLKSPQGEIRIEGDAQSIEVAEKQADAATEECYDAWRAMNDHHCDAGCTRR